jgi:hypothetical protein
MALKRSLSFGLSPCIVSFLDAIFLEREYPSLRLVGVSFGVLGTVGCTQVRR